MPTCKTCGRSIAWGEAHKTGKRVPLDTPPEKRWVYGKNGKLYHVDTYASHFTTCPHAENWRGRTREQGPDLFATSNED